MNRNVLDNYLKFQTNVNSCLMKYEDASYIAASAKHINKTNSVVLPISSKICLTFYNDLYLYTQDSFPYSMSFKKELINSLMSNSDIHDIE